MEDYDKRHGDDCDTSFAYFSDVKDEEELQLCTYNGWSFIETLIKIERVDYLDIIVRNVHPDQRKGIKEQKLQGFTKTSNLRSVSRTKAKPTKLELARERYKQKHKRSELKDEQPLNVTLKKQSLEDHDPLCTIKYNVNLLT